MDDTVTSPARVIPISSRDQQAKPVGVLPLWRDQSNADMRAEIARAEKVDANSRAGFAYDILNQGPGGKDDRALGRYQFRNISLYDLGLKDAKNNWRRDTRFYAAYHITSDEQFLNNPAAQEDVMTAYMARQEFQTRKIYASYRGYSYVGIHSQKITVTLAGLVGASHRAGAGDVSHYLDFVESHHGDLSGMTLVRLNEKPHTYFSAIETRLRVFQDVPYSSAGWPKTIPNPLAPKPRKT